MGDGFVLGFGVAGFEGAAGVVEAAELDGDAGADSDERGEGAFVEGGGAFVAEDLGCAVEGASVVCRGLEADFDDIFASVYQRESTFIEVVL